MISTQNRFIFHTAPFKLSASMFGDEVVNEAEYSSRPVSEIPIFPIGKFEAHHDIPNGFDITPETIQGFVDTFESGVQGDELPVYAGHGDGYTDRPAVGWVKSLINKGDKGLWGVVEWTYEGAALVRDKAFKYISPEWLFDYIDPRNKQKIKNILFAPALVNEPYFQMPAVTASKNKSNIIIITSSMNTKDLLLKAVEELTDEEKEYLRKHKEEVEQEELTDEQRAALDAVLVVEEKDDSKDDSTEEEKQEDKKEEEGKEEGSNSEEEGKEGDEAADVEGGEEAGAEEAEKATASRDKQVRITASRLAQLEADSVAYQNERITASVKKAGVVPAQVDSVAAFAMKLEKELQEEFLSIITKAKAGLSTKRITSSEKEGENSEPEFATAQDELIARAEAHAEQEKTTLDKAITHISMTDPALMNRVDDERSGISE